MSNTILLPTYLGSHASVSAIRAFRFTDLERAHGKRLGTIKQLFSNDNIKKSGVNLVAAYMSCPADTSVDHKGFFTVDASDDAKITKFFGPMKVEIRPVQPLSEVAKKL